MHRKPIAPINLLVLIAASLMLATAIGCNSGPTAAQKEAQRDQFIKDMNEMAGKQGGGPADPAAKKELEESGEG